jgi:DNA-binding transcriptional LysR family regulator
MPPRVDLDVDRLRILVEVVHAGSIAEAARRMAFTPSALSQQIAKLERQLGTRLLERGAAGVSSTAIGDVLVRHGERVLGELRDAHAAVIAALTAEPQRLSLGTFATAGKVLVPAALAALRRRHPHAELSLLDLEPPAGYGLVTSRDLDLLITHRYPGVPSVPYPGLHRERLLTDPLRLVLPTSHPLSTPSPTRHIALTELADEDWISGGHGVPNRTCLHTLANQIGLKPHVAYETADYQVTLALLGAGLGIALVPASLLTDTDHSRITIHHLHGIHPARDISIVHRKNPPPLVQELVTLLRTAAHNIT